MIQFFILKVILMAPWFQLSASFGGVANAFVLLPPPRSRNAFPLDAITKASWGIGDDWSSLSNENPENSVPDTDDIFDEDLARQAAKRMEYSPSTDSTPPSKEEEWINQAVDEVHNHGMFHSPDDPLLYDTGFESYTQTVSFLDEMGEQISMLVHCNERPEDLLVREGRALAPLSDKERNDVKQLVVESKKGGEYEMTDFFREAVGNMFRQHARAEQDKDGESHTYLDATGVAEWMTQCLGSEKNRKITQHDRRVLTTMSTFGKYGTGKLQLEDFERLYVSAVTDFLNGKTIKAGRGKKMKLPTVDSVWRDIRSHGILSPIEQERQKLAEDIRAEFGAGNKEETQAKGKLIADTLMDECEIIEWKEGSKVSSYVSDPDGTSETGNQKRRSRSSHELVELASDEKTPLRMKDGEFVFIDEESCIGCTACASACPSSFLMLESGRARTFKQRRASDVSTAISVCPVNCMHKVGFEELKEMESARDRGDGRSDHRHLGHRRGHTPLSVAGIDSDANHKSSWYHYLKQKCYTSSDCPKRGCYDCPNFRNPGDNPYFKAKEKKAHELRVKDMMANGDADLYRKTAEL